MISNNNAEADVKADCLEENITEAKPVRNTGDVYLTLAADLKL